MFSLLRRITGVDLLRDLAEFFDAIAVMVDGMAERASEVRALLSDPATGFVLVSSPDPEPAAETAALRRRLDEDGLDYAGAVLNRVALERFGDPTALADEIASATPGAEDALAASLRDRLERLSAEAERHAAALERARSDLGAPLALGPRAASPPVDLEGLARLLGSLRRG